MSGESSTFHHRPVMVAEVTAVFSTVAAGTLIDATVGGGGHARAILEANPGLRLLGLDRDPLAIEAATATLTDFGDRVTLRQARFDRLAHVAAELGNVMVTGVLFDLGVSSPQLDAAQRGFSYRQDAELDMRMGPDADRRASDIVNTYTEQQIATVLRTYGDERFASRIARAIVAERPLSTTTELAEVIRSAIPAAARRSGGHPATRSFQAIRIEVNRELEVLPVALDAAIGALAPGGRLAVLSYHSGEDRLVKERLRLGETGGCTCPPALPCVCGAVPELRLLWRKGRKAGHEEIEDNRRAGSARLRAAEKLSVAA